MDVKIYKESPAEQVRDLQRKLATLTHGTPASPLYRGACNGIFGPDTEAAILLFKQNEKHAEPDTVCDAATWHAINARAGSVFAETWQFELDALRGQLPAQVSPVRPGLLKEAHRAELAGLAFSGGGIRSATFSLGVLQAMAELKMLRDFDYLSTVSGGGYIGAWFSKWLHHLGGKVEAIEQQLTPGKTGEPVVREPEQIRFLRQHSNYLTPKTGMFSADTWAVLTTYIRNMLLNLTILVALMAAVMALPRLLALAVNDHIDDSLVLFGTTVAPFGWSGFTLISIASVLLAVFWIAVSISLKPDSARTKWIRGQRQGAVILFIVVPLMVAAFAGSCALWKGRGAIAREWDALLPFTDSNWVILLWLFAPGVAYFTAWALGWGLAQWYNRSQTAAGKAQPARKSKREWIDFLGEAGGHLVCALSAFAVGSLIVILLMSALARRHLEISGSDPSAMVNVVAFGMPVLLIVFGITMVLSVGLVGRMYNDQSREWWSRQGAWTCIFVAAWLALVAVSLYAPALLAYVGMHLGPWTKAALASTWAGTTLAGLLLGGSSATGKRGSRPYLEFIAGLAPFVFSIGAVLFVSLLVHAATQSGEIGVVLTEQDKLSAFFVEYNEQTLKAHYERIWWATAIFLVVGLVLTWRVDINKFSLHMMYRARLVRAYLGASNEERAAHPFSGFDEGDDIHMHDLLKTAAPPPDKASAPATLQRPFHIVNTALNLVNGAELAWQTRKAAAFSFSPAFCGFELPAMGTKANTGADPEALRGIYRPTQAYCATRNGEDDPESGIKLGMAISVSGAAASPSMGYHSSPPLSFLMTLFNVRLGRWFANPRRKAPDGSSTSPRMGLLYLISELFGLTNANSDFVYLSDGGHFENLGVYELVRRRCRLIVVIDAGADGNLTFEDLGNAIRKCATDLRVEIEIDVGRIDLQRNAQFSESYCVLGKIHYGKVDQDGEEGTILYIKPSLLGDECADVLNYRKANLAFPHQTTADQWFDEPQFESYRALGYHIGISTLTAAANAATRDRDTGRRCIASLCTELKAHWGRKPQSGNVVQFGKA